jgi:hypothetical protein
VLIDSPALADGVADKITALMSPAWSYRLTRSPQVRLVWTSQEATGRELRYTRTTPARRGGPASRTVYWGCCRSRGRSSLSALARSGCVAWRIDRVGR